MVQKANIGPEAVTLIYRLASVPGTDHARVEWLGESEVTASSVMAQSADPVEREEASEAELWLSDLLATGSMAATDVYRDGKKDGYAERTLKRAKSALGVKAERRGYGKEGGWFWTLPAPAYASVPTDVTAQTVTVDDA